MSEKLKQPAKNESLEKALEAASQQLEDLESKSGIEVKEVKDASINHEKEKLKAKAELEKQLENAEKDKPRIEKSEKEKPPVNRGVKKQQYKATMRRVESRLPTYQRSFSKIIHNKTVDAVSNIASKTIARPSGLLGGALFAFIGLTLIYFNATRIGFEYNSGSAFIFLASIGWLSGILIEYIVIALKKIFNDY